MTEGKIVFCFFNSYYVYLTFCTKYTNMLLKIFTLALYLPDYVFFDKEKCPRAQPLQNLRGERASLSFFQKNFVVHKLKILQIESF